MSDTVALLVEDDRWNALDLTALAETCLRGTLRAVGLPEVFEISILACDDARIADLNAAFRGKSKPTNVLSWPAADLAPDVPGDVPHPPSPDDAELGDIALAFETVRAEAQDGGISLIDHTTHLLIHAVLHLLGYDHETDADAQRMQMIEVATLAKLGIADPY